MTHPRDVLGPALIEAIEQLVDERIVRVMANYRQRDWPEYLDVPTAARYLGCSENRVRHLQYEGVLRPHQDKPGARVFFKRSEVDEAMARWRR